MAIPFFGYNTIKTNEQPSTNIKKDLGQKLIEADQLFLEDKYDDVVHLLEQYKVQCCLIAFLLCEKKKKTIFTVYFLNLTNFPKSSVPSLS